MTVFLIVIRQNLIDVMSTKHTPIVVISSAVLSFRGFKKTEESPGKVTL